MTVENVVIVGSGPAGLSAGIYAARAGLAPLVIEGQLAGGQLVQTSEVENYPGFAEPVSGIAIMDAMRRQADRAGVRFEMDEIVRVDFSGTPRTLFGLACEYRARTVVIATGARPRWTGLPGESEYRGRGVSACATCDGAFFKGRDVAVIGGGDTALADAMHLAGICRKVYVVHRRDAFRGARALADRILSMANVEVVWNETVSAFTGDGRALTGIALAGGRRLDVAGAFIAIGHVPQTDFLDGALELDNAGCIKTVRTRTGVPGVFAAGDCADPLYRQAVVAAAAGAQAAIEALGYVQKGE